MGQSNLSANLGSRSSCLHSQADSHHKPFLALESSLKKRQLEMSLLLDQENNSSLANQQYGSLARIETATEKESENFFMKRSELLEQEECKSRSQRPTGQFNEADRLNELFQFTGQVSSESHNARLFAEASKQSFQQTGSALGDNGWYSKRDRLMQDFSKNLKKKTTATLLGQSGNINLEPLQPYEKPDPRVQFASVAAPASNCSTTLIGMRRQNLGGRNEAQASLQRKDYFPGYTLRQASGAPAHQAPPQTAPSTSLQTLRAGLPQSLIDIIDQNATLAANGLPKLGSHSRQSSNNLGSKYSTSREAAEMKELVKFSSLVSEIQIK